MPGDDLVELHLSGSLGCIWLYLSSSRVANSGQAVLWPQSCRPNLRELSSL
jgi:hypothetical protein